MVVLNYYSFMSFIHKFFTKQAQLRDYMYMKEVDDEEEKDEENQSLPKPNVVVLCCHSNWNLFRDISHLKYSFTMIVCGEVTSNRFC